MSEPITERYGVIVINDHHVGLEISENGSTYLTAGEPARRGVLTDQLQAVGTLLLILDRHHVTEYEIID